jgi:hypothetical protein
MTIVNMNSDWVKIDCENNWEMRSIDKITQDILNEIK